MSSFRDEMTAIDDVYKRQALERGRPSCPHPDERIRHEIDDYDVLRTRCQSCELLLLVVKLPENEAYLLRRQHEPRRGIR
jgi:hypothetical protein